jgi:hypothetical protein
MSQVLTSKLAGVRRKQSAVTLGIGAALIVSLIVPVLMVEMLTDWLIELPWATQSGLPWGVRAVVLLALVAAIAWIVIFWIVNPIAYGSDDETLALMVEHDKPSFGGRLIAAVQLTLPGAVPAGASLALVHATVGQAEQLARDIDFQQVVSVQRMLKLMGIAALIVMVGLVGFAYGYPGSEELLMRALLGNGPVPRHTLVDKIEPGNARVAEGDSVVISADYQGIKPSGPGVLTVSYDNSGSTYDFQMDSDPDSGGRFARKIENVNESFAYRIRLNDGTSDKFHIECVERPSVKTMVCTQIYPAYVHLPDADHLPGDLSVLAGSRLIVKLTANKRLKQTQQDDRPFNRIHLTGTNEDFPLQVDPNDPTQAVTPDASDGRGIPLKPGVDGLSIYLVDEEGIETKDPAVYHIELLPDLPPKVNIIKPTAREETVTKIATETIVFDASDDYALGKVELRYTVDGVAQPPIPLSIKTADGRDHPKSVSGASYDWLMQTVSSGNRPDLEGCAIEYWLHAEDQNTVSNPGGKPGTTETDHYTLKVVTAEEKLDDLRKKAEEIPGDLAPVKDEQENLSQQTIDFGHKATTPAPAPAPQQP